MPDAPATDKDILNRLRNVRTQYRRVQDKMQVRRAIVQRVIETNWANNGTGTNVISPFDSSQMIIRSTLGEGSKAVQNYAGRLSTNQPSIKVTPITTKPGLTKRMDRVAGEQERMDAELWREACAISGGRGEQQRAAMAMVVGAAAFLLTLPRDLAFGLPDRIYYDDLTDEEIAVMIRDGKLSPSKVPHPKTGQPVYAEGADVWASRRKEVMQAQKVSGKGLFMLRALPRDMVLREKDLMGIKWGAVTETVPASTFGKGSPWAMAAASRDKSYTGTPADYQLMLNDRGQVIGGLSVGAPLNYQQRGRDTTFTFITYVDREDLVYLVSGPNDVDGGKEIWRGKHGCMVQGQPSCPLVEIPCVRGDIDLPEYEFMTPLDPLFAMLPNANQILTILSNVSVWNGTPRFVAENVDGANIRGTDGEPTNSQSAPTPGMNPEQIAAYPGTVKQLTIPADDLIKALDIIFNRIDKYMPSPVTDGASGASAPAWQVHQLIQQSQENLRQPADNMAGGINQVILMWHGWLRQLDVPVYFWAAPGHRKDERSTKGLIEFDPKDITDSITVSLELDSPEDLIVLDQVGQAKLKDGLITRQTYFEEYARAEDAYDATIKSYAQTVADSLLFGRPLPGSSLLAIVAQRVMGRLQVELPGWSDNAARAQAQDMAMGARDQVAQQQAAMTTAPSGGEAPAGVLPPPAPSEPIVAGSEDLSVANAAGVRAPGVGMAPTLVGARGGF